MAKPRFLALLDELDLHGRDRARLRAKARNRARELAEYSEGAVRTIGKSDGNEPLSEVIDRIVTDEARQDRWWA
jgi:hypothetical protein